MTGDVMKEVLLYRCKPFKARAAFCLLCEAQKPVSRGATVGAFCVGGASEAKAKVLKLEENLIHSNTLKVIPKCALLKSEIF